MKMNDLTKSPIKFALDTIYLTRYNTDSEIKNPIAWQMPSYGDFFMPEKALSGLSPTGSCRIGVWEVEIVGFSQVFVRIFVRAFAGY